MRNGKYIVHSVRIVCSGLGGGAQLVHLWPGEVQVGKERSQRGHSKGDKIVSCKHSLSLLKCHCQALSLKDNLQMASYKAKIEKWDMDTDSDDSKDDLGGSWCRQGVR